MLTMYTRLLSPPNHSFFLFGPRATGKTTWLKEHFESQKGTEWRRSWGGGLKELLAKGIIDKGFCVYRGTKILKDGDILVTPFFDMINKINEVFSF